MPVGKTDVFITQDDGGSHQFTMAPHSELCDFTFLGAALFIASEQEDVLGAAVALQLALLQQPVHPLDDALQAFIHVYPNLLLRAQKKTPQTLKPPEPALNPGR